MVACTCCRRSVTWSAVISRTAGVPLSNCVRGRCAAGVRPQASAGRDPPPPHCPTSGQTGRVGERAGGVVGVGFVAGRGRGGGPTSCVASGSRVVLMRARSSCREAARSWARCRSACVCSLSACSHGTCSVRISRAVLQQHDCGSAAPAANPVPTSFMLTSRDRARSAASAGQELFAC